MLKFCELAATIQLSIILPSYRKYGKKSMAGRANLDLRRKYLSLQPPLWVHVTKATPPEISCYGHLPLPFCRGIMKKVMSFNAEKVRDEYNSAPNPLQRKALSHILEELSICIKRSLRRKLR